MKNIILAGTGVGGLFLGVVIARVIGMMTGIIIGLFILIPHF